MTHPLPSKLNRNTAEEIYNYDQIFGDLIEKLRMPEKDTLIVYFSSIHNFAIPLEDEFISNVKPDQILDFQDGKVLLYKKKNNF